MSLVLLNAILWCNGGVRARTVGYEALVLICLLQCTLGKQLHFNLLLWFLQMKRSEPKLCCHVVFRNIVTFDLLTYACLVQGGVHFSGHCTV